MILRGVHHHTHALATCAVHDLSSLPFVVIYQVHVDGSAAPNWLIGLAGVWPVAPELRDLGSATAGDASAKE